MTAGEDRPGELSPTARESLRLLSRTVGPRRAAARGWEASGRPTSLSHTQKGRLWAPLSSFLQGRERRLPKHLTQAAGGVPKRGRPRSRFGVNSSERKPPRGRAQGKVHASSNQSQERKGFQGQRLSLGGKGLSLSAGTRVAPSPWPQGPPCWFPSPAALWGSSAHPRTHLPSHYLCVHL